jgi:hypothetical protein
MWIVNARGQAIFQISWQQLNWKMSFLKSALLSEFGWEPINEFLDRQRVNYFARFYENVET